MNRSIAKSLLAVIAVVAILKIAAAIVGAYFFIPFFMEHKEKIDRRSQEVERQWKINDERIRENRKQIEEDLQRMEERRKNQ